ncbi:M23 family metallopeptidase [Arthrobacter sp. AD-310]
MKPPVLLAAFLLLPASVASVPQPLAYRPAPSAVPSAAPGASSPASSAAAAGMVMSAAPAAINGVAAPDWEWPLVPRPRVLRPFDPPPKPWLSGHRGVDLAAPSDGSAVMSPAAGTVSFAGVVVDRPVITIDHGGGLRSSFEPVDSTLAVGEVVAAGQVIGTALPGHCPVPCLHWGVRRGEDYINPLQFVMDLRPSVLLPLGGPPQKAFDQTMAEIPVMARPATRVLISAVPS